MKELEEYTSKFVSESDKPIILEAFVSDFDESDAYLKLINKNKSKNTKESVKGMVKGILGEKTYRKLKQTVKG